MKFPLLVLELIFNTALAFTQYTQIQSGGELAYHGTTDISLDRSIKWNTARGLYPGYVSIIGQANFTGYSDQFNINGYVKKYGNNNFIFPVGTGQELRSLEISKPNLDTDTYATAWIEGDPSRNLDPTLPHTGEHPVNIVREPIVLVSTKGQWDWQVGHAGNLGNQTTGTGDGIRVTVSIPDMTNFAEKAELRLVGWNGLAWIDLSLRPSATGNNKNSRLSGTMKPDITALAVGKVQPKVVGRFENLQTKTVNCRTLLSWKTSIETDSSRFVIEKSIDGVHFSPIDSFNTKGSNNGYNYSILINQDSSITYYRLYIESADGYITRSTIISHQLMCNYQGHINIFPNPAMRQSNITAQFRTVYNGPAIIKVFNTLGQSIMSIPIVCRTGVNTISINISNLINGTYILEINDSQGKPINKASSFIK
jgi:hypothetical protein